jgi:hypothetical protein
MKTQIIAGFVSFFFMSSFAYSGVYKCEGVDGKVAYQSHPCAKEDKTSVIKITSSNSTDHKQSKVSAKTEPSGQWVNPKNRNFKASISKSGGFEMTDISGEKLKGTWKTEGDGKYAVKATFQGMSFPVNMKYEVATDILLLSKPGFPNSFTRYQRQ